jgi:hypothetical protein
VKEKYSAEDSAAGTGLSSDFGVVMSSSGDDVSGPKLRFWSDTDTQAESWLSNQVSGAADHLQQWIRGKPEAKVEYEKKLVDGKETVERKVSTLDALQYWCKRPVDQLHDAGIAAFASDLFSMPGELRRRLHSTNGIELIVSHVCRR